MNTYTSIKSRKSPETFLSTPLKQSDIQLIVEAGGYAPLFGELHFTVVQTQEIIEQINTVSIEMMKHSGNEFAEKMANTPGYHAVRNAQAMIVLSAKGGNDPMGFNMANVSCAAENMLLAATDLQIGSRFMMGPVMSLTQSPLKETLKIPGDFTPLVVVALGNIADSFNERTKVIQNISFI